MAEEKSNVSLKSLDEYKTKDWYPVVETILDCKNLETPLSEDDFEKLKMAYNVAAQQNDIAVNSKQPCDSRWSYIIGYMLHTYGSNPDIKKEAIPYLQDATNGDTNERCAAACYLLGTIYIQQENTRQAAYKYFALAYNSECKLAEKALKKYAVDTYQRFIDFYKGGRRTHRKKRELRKRTLHKKRKNRTKRRA